MAERPNDKVLTPAFVTGVGVRASLGLSGLHAAMLVRARRGEPRETRFLDKRSRHVGVHRALGPKSDVHGVPRMVALAAPALRASVPLGEAGGPSAYTLFLAVPEAGRPDDDPRYSGEIVAMIGEAAGVPIDASRSRAIRAGHAGTAFALEAALDEIQRGAQTVLVGAVDSYYHPDVLAWLDEECRLHSIDAENGFIPGEGAAFLRLTASLSRTNKSRDALARESREERLSREAREAREAPALLRRVETGREETVTSDAPNIGAAMTGILRDLASSAPNGKLAWSLTDVNGERHRVREWGLAAGRGAFSDDAVHHRPADELGDLGAASGAVLAGLAVELSRAGAAPKSHAVVALASDGVERGAFLLSFEGAAR